MYTAVFIQRLQEFLTRFWNNGSQTWIVTTKDVLCQCLHVKQGMSVDRQLYMIGFSAVSVFLYPKNDSPSRYRLLADYATETVARKGSPLLICSV